MRRLVAVSLLAALATGSCAPALQDARTRLTIGELDDWTPAGSCVRLTEVLRASGQDVTIMVYPGAHHSFDNVGRGFVRLPNVDSGADCAFRMASILGPFPPTSEAMRCVRKGATIACNPEAAAQARRNVRAQLAELLK